MSIGAAVVGIGSCPLVLGECVQGRLPNGRHFLITSPVGLFSWAEFRTDPDGGPLRVDPPDRCKSLAAVRAYLGAHDLPESGALRINTPLEPGRGFGTSTADIAASLRAVAAARHRTIAPETIARLAIAIEPSDGSMYHGCVAFAHRDGLLLERFGPLPQFHAVVACADGIVDTVAFDGVRVGFRYTPHDQRALLLAWDMMRHAVAHQDVALMARASTVSAMINEQLLPKPMFAEMRQFQELAGIEGLMAAHSGTALALILDPARPRYHERLACAREFVADLRPPVALEISSDRVRTRAVAPTEVAAEAGRDEWVGVAGLPG
jgi:uncharacterized protein involved in propanediol utilization